MTTIAADEFEALARTQKVVNMLKEWADWSRGYRMRIGYPERSPGFAIGGGVVTRDTSDEQADDAANQRCDIIDRCVDDLREPAQRAAIHHCYLQAVFRMRDYDTSLLDAHAALDIAFRRKGILW
jgi:hypothetical protein